MMKLTILMPCLNEEETIGVCIKKAQKWINEKKIDAEILVSDNGSKDRSQQIARNLGARVIYSPEKGYGAALSFGYINAKGKYIIIGDSDDSYDFSKLDSFIDKLDEGYDLVIGNRFVGGIEPGAMPWKNRYIGNPVISWMGRVLFSCPVQDFHCGLRGCTKEAFIKMDLRTTGMEFASEMVIKASILGMKICEVPTTLSKDGRSRSPHLRPWRDGWRHLRFMMVFSPMWLFFYPGLILFLLSLFIYALLLRESFRIDGVEYDIHTLLYVQSGVVIGGISCCFGIIVRLFGIRERLLAEHPLMEIITKKPILEIGLIVSILLILLGIYIASDTLSYWGNHSFGRLEYGILIREVSTSTLTIIMGFLLAFLSLISGFLSIPVKK